MKLARTCQLHDLLWLEDERYRRLVNSNGGLRWLKSLAIHSHHVFGGTSRIDGPANEIDLSMLAHEFVHEITVAGKVACLYRLRQLGRLDWEFSNRCAGRDVRLYLSGKTMTGVYERWRTELLK